MVASSKRADDLVASIKADLAAQQGLNKKISGQMKDKDARIRELEAEIAALKAKTGASSYP